MQRSYIDYAMAVIVGRALPDVRDGLKPVHRRVLYAMYDGGYRPDRGFSKCSRVVGDVMGQYHPHGDTAIYDTLVRLAQPWVMRAPLVNGQGNFGSPGNDPAAAMRYTECRMAPLAMEMVRDIDEDTVDFQPNYDGRSAEPVDPAGALPQPAGQRLGRYRGRHGHQHPAAQPARGRRRRAAGLLEHPDATREELLDALLERIKGPDFPIGALIVGHQGIEQTYRTGRGSVTMRAVIDIDEDAKGRTFLSITELPYQVNPDNLALKIAELADAGKIQGIADVRDDTSGRTGQRLVVVLKRDAVARVVLNNLLKHTELQTNFSANMLALVDGVPAHADARPVRLHWVTHQVEVIQRRTRYRLRKAEEQAHIFRGLVKALDMLDEVIALIRRSPDADEAREGLMALLEIDELQARAILDMQLRRLAALERQRIIDELAKLEATIADLEDILASEERQRQIISDELAAIVDKFGNERRSQIIPADGDLSMEDLIPDEELVVTITRGGYAKRTRADLYRTQKRGGKGVRGATLRGDDVVEHFMATSNHHWLLFFTTAGRVYRTKAYNLPEASRDAKGGHVAGLLSFQPDERHRPGARDPRLRAGALPRAGHPQRPGQEDPPGRLQQPAPGRRDRDQLPRGRRRADRRRAGRRRRRHPAGLPQGRRRSASAPTTPAAADGARDLRRHRDEVPRRRRAALDVGDPCRADRRRGGRAESAAASAGESTDAGDLPDVRRAVRLHDHRRRLRQAHPDLGLPAAVARRPRHQGDEAGRRPGQPGRRLHRRRGRRGAGHQAVRPGHPQRDRREPAPHRPRHQGREFVGVTSGDGVAVGGPQRGACHRDRGGGREAAEEASEVAAPVETHR